MSIPCSCTGFQHKEGVLELKKRKVKGMAETMLGLGDTTTNQADTDFSFISILSMVFSFMGHGREQEGRQKTSKQTDK